MAENSGVRAILAAGYADGGRLAALFRLKEENRQKFDKIRQNQRRHLLTKPE
jgi:hypothetical protein